MAHLLTVPDGFLGIDPHKVMASPIGRTVKLSEGSVVPALLA
jgi:hypothetical protein